LIYKDIVGGKLFMGGNSETPDGFKPGFARKVLHSLRSRRKHKAWGRKPQVIIQGGG